MCTGEDRKQESGMACGTVRRRGAAKGVEACAAAQETTPRARHIFYTFPPLGHSAKALACVTEISHSRAAKVDSDDNFQKGGWRVGGMGDARRQAISRFTRPE